MFKCFVGIAKSSRQVEVALDDLQKNGFIAADISVFMPNSGEIPELGPVKGTKAPKEADSPLMAALTGAGARAGAGGVAGALVSLGIPENEAKAYEGPVKRGGYLVAVNVKDGAKEDVVRDIMKNNGLEDISSVSEV